MTGCGLSWPTVAESSRPIETPTSGDSVAGRIGPTTGRWFDRLSRAHALPDAAVVELHLSFGGKAQVSALPDNTGYLICVFPPGAPHEEGGDNATDVSMVIRYDEGLTGVVEALHLTPERSPR